MSESESIGIRKYPDKNYRFIGLGSLKIGYIRSWKLSGIESVVVEIA